jgi:hypothetical protein
MRLQTKKSGRRKGGDRRIKAEKRLNKLDVNFINLPKNILHYKIIP